MAIITFVSEGIKETGQTMSISAIATAMAIEHNYRILLISTDFRDKTLEDCFWNNRRKKGIAGLTDLFTAKANIMDISNGLEGLVRTFTSNRASGDTIKSYTKPVLNERLDVLQAPKATAYVEYERLSQYYDQIAQTANEAYDLVLIDLSSKMSNENRQKVLNISDIIVVNLLQSMTSINNFLQLKTEDEFYKKNNVLLMLGRYNPGSRYSNKNVARYLKERSIPMVVPYNILFADECSEGRIIDYFLKVQKVEGFDNKDTYFINQLRGTIQMLEEKIQARLSGRI